MIWRSLKVPGSDSSAFTAMYLGKTSFGTKLHLTPVGKPAPPRPRLRREGRRTLLQPQLEDVQPADVVHCLCRGPELQHFGAADALLLFLQHKRDGPLVEPPVARHGPRQPQPDAAHHQALARLHERIAPA